MNILLTNEDDILALSVGEITENDVGKPIPYIANNYTYKATKRDVGKLVYMECNKKRNATFAMFITKSHLNKLGDHYANV